jgi:hypothetical protein
MVRAVPLLPPRVGLRVGRRIVPAIPVVLHGDEASLVLAAAPPLEQDVHLVLDWEDGSVTELTARVRAVEEGGRIAHVELCRVAGDWAAFCRWLGRQAG